MRRFLIPSVVVVLALLIAVPSFALEVKYGGLFRARVLSDYNFTQSNENTGTYGYPTVSLGSPQLTPYNAFNLGDQKGGVPYVQHLNRFDQRLRMFFDFISSENLKVVVKLEANTVWGSYGSAAARNIVGGGNVGADNNNLGVKNTYVDFKIPNTPLRAMVGVQGIALMDSWIIDSDFSAAMLTADLKPFTVTVGYISGQNFNTLQESDNVDDLAAIVSYKEGPFSASLMGVWQDAHNTPASVFPNVGTLYDDPIQTTVPFAASFNGGGNIPNPWNPNNYIFAKHNNLFDLGFQLGYKLDYLSAYLNFVKNFGSVQLGSVGTVSPTVTAATLAAADPNNANTDKAKYTGWMIDAGVNYFCGPFTANLGGFYTSGQKLNFVATNPNLAVTAANPQVVAPNGSNINYFTYPLSTSKYFSEIIGGGILDNIAPNGGYWGGYPNPNNLWTVTLGGAYQVLPQTKLALSYWYFATAEKVPSKFNNASGTWSTSSSVGHEVDLNITQNIVDKLNLDLVGAYMFTGEAYRARSVNINYPHDQNAYELGARLQWAF
jgi:hypothetical protein